VPEGYLPTNRNGTDDVGTADASSDAGVTATLEDSLRETWLTPDAAAEIETPALIVDLDGLEANIDRMATAMRERGVALRPHAKTHKSIEIARRQLAAGAIGLTVATIGEAEVFADAGVEDLFIAYPVIAQGAKVERLRRLATRCRLSIGVDSLFGAHALAVAFGGMPPPPVLIEIDAGGRRSGLLPADAGELAKHAMDGGLPVEGVFTHAGHSYASPEIRGKAADEEVAGLAAAADSLRDVGVEPLVVSAGSTPTAVLSARSPVTEERPGTYALGDRMQAALAGDPDDDASSIALGVAATVVSHGARGGFLIDAGAKMLGKDVAPFLTGHGAVVGYPDATIERVNDHHGVATVAQGTARPQIGDVVVILPNHVCPVVNLVDELLVVQGGELVGRWRVEARGRNA
jgi:D-serine deaminase-like pyridoxal phosphate-dependent protein